MPVEWQWILVAAGVAWAAFFVLRRAWLTVFPGKGAASGCGGCGGCAKDGAPPLVSLDANRVELHQLKGTRGFQP